MPQTYAPIIAGAGGILLEAPDTLPSVGVLALAVDAAGKMSSVAFPSTTRETLGLATTDSPTFAGVTAATFGVSSGSVIHIDSDGSNPCSISALSNRIDIATNGSFRFSVNSGAGYQLSVRASDVLFYASANVGAHNTYDLGTTFQKWRTAYLVNLQTSVIQGSDNTLEQRNGTTGQKSRIYKTYTSATSGEWLELDATGDASNFDIASSIGSAGGTARGIRIGGKNAAGTFTSWLRFDTSGVATFAGAINTNNAFIDFTSATTGTKWRIDYNIPGAGQRWQCVNSNGTIAVDLSGRADQRRLEFANTANTYIGLASIGSGDSSRNGFRYFTTGGGGGVQLIASSGTGLIDAKLRMGGVNSSFPMLKQTGTTINFCLADDSAAAPISASNALFYKVNTSATSYEALQIDATGDASNFDIAASIGSAGGTARGIRIGGKNAAGTFTSWIEFLTNGRQRQFGVETYNVGTAVGHQVIGGSFLWGHNNSGLVLNSGNRIGWAGGIESSPSHVIIPVGSTIDTRSGAGFRVRNSSNTDYESLECKAITASGTINGRASTTSAATAPIKIATGVLMTTPEVGAIEYDGTNLYFTDSGGVRRTLAVV